MIKTLPQSFFNRKTIIVAQELLGKYLVRRYRRKIILGIITEVEVYDGPREVTRYFKIDKCFNGKTANKKTGLWIEDRGIQFSKKQIVKSKRIGVDYAGPIWGKKRLRFYIKNQ